MTAIQILLHKDSYISKTAYKETQQYKNGRTNIT